MQDLIEKLPDLSDKEKLLATAFIKKHREQVEKVKEHNDHEKSVQPLMSAQDVKATDDKAEKLSRNAKAQKVPSTRLARMASFGGLGISLGIGAASEASKRVLGLTDPNASLILSESNAEKIVETLCRVRGAALKIGQMLSIQDESMISPEVSKIFERVRQSADYMPAWQMNRVMTAEFGNEWRSKFLEFNDQPFAAASIGQVHKGKLHDGRHVAVKIQYPGVAKGIASDINNLLGVLKIANILPESNAYIIICINIPMSSPSFLFT